MNIWLIYPYETLPNEGGRPGRAEMAAASLLAEGHKVTLWVWSFDHRIKKHRVSNLLERELAENFSLKIIPTLGYSKNISILRVFSEIIFGKRFLELAKKCVRPDVIIITEPSTFYWRYVFYFIKLKKIILIIDLIDLWPEIFKLALPSWLRGFHKTIFKPLYKLRASKFRHADGVIAVSPAYTDIARDLSPHLSMRSIETVYYGVEVEKFRNSMTAPDCLNLEYSIERALNNGSTVNIIFASSLGSNYDVQTVLDCIPLLEGFDFQLIIAGAGPLEGYVREYLRNLKSRRAHFICNPSADQMARLYGLCDIGISAYLRDSTVSMPIKAFHYTAAGLAIVNSLEGDFSKLLAESGAGVAYEAQNKHSLADAIGRYLVNTEFLKQSKKESYLLGSRFDAKAQYLKLSNMLKSLEPRA